MAAKARIVEELGETALVLPRFVADGLRANDRVKYYMSLMQACREHAARPDSTPSDLRAEREASGEDDATLDEVVGGSRAGTDGAVLVPHAARIHEQLLNSIEQMFAPLRVNGADLALPLDTYERRLATLRDHLPAVTGETVPAGYVETVTRAERHGADSLHLLVMDLHRELNRIQSRLTERILDGASVYGLAETDQPLVQAFMRGVNATAPLKFGHPGLGTTATRMGSQLVIQNDIGTTDAHVLVIHVADLNLSFIYTDIHRARLRFFKGLFDQVGMQWNERGPAADGQYETCVGQRTCKNVDELQELLAFLGSRLVFLIDWNRARKRLSRFVKKSDAVAALRWAADHGYGHRAFLDAGGERLVYNALERTADSQLPYGARLDEVLGREAALAFLQAVLRITSEALQQHRSLRLLRDEVQAELLGHLHESQQGVLALAADHAALVVALALALRDALLRMRSDASGGHWPSVAERAKRWETKADEIVNHARQAQRHVPDSEAVARLLTEADDVADGLEDAIFLMTLLRAHEPGREAVETLKDLAELTVSSAQEYVKCLEVARDIRRSGTRDDVQQFLVAVDRVVILEHESDETERRAKAVMLKAADDFRALHVLSQIARGLEESVDGLARCALMLRDYVMSEMLVE
jgi:uncharacterized protein Yka (UPF0111/DUF47 family)